MARAVQSATASEPGLAPLPASVPSFRHVVAATDFSDAANDAIGHAFAAVCPGGEVSVVHVVEEGTFDSETRRRLIDDVRALAVGYRRPAQNASLRVEFVERRDRVRGLCDYAERHEADLICVAGASIGFIHEVLLSTGKPVLITPVVEPSFNHGDTEGTETVRFRP